VFVDLGAQPAIRMRHTVILVLSSCTCYLLTISHTARFPERVIGYKLCVLILYRKFVWKISHSKKKKKWARYHKSILVLV